MLRLRSLYSKQVAHQIELKDLPIYGAATWRVTYMLVNETGPFDIFVKLRELWGIKHDEDGVPLLFPHGVPLACMWCTSVWVAAAMIFVPRKIVELLAVSATAIGLGELNGKS